MYTEDSDYPEWYMNNKQRGIHNLKIIVYDKAGNSNLVSKEITVFKIFGN